MISSADLVVSKQKLRRAEAIACVRLKRQEPNQNLGFASRPSVLCGLPIKKPAAGQLLHERRNGQFSLQVPLFGDFGLVNQLGSSDYARPRKFRERLEGWLDLVRSRWPECPAAMDTTGHRIVGGQSECRPACGREVMRTSERRTGIWRLSLEQIEATVADHLGN